MSTARSLRVEAVVLRHSDWGEADRLLVVYTREAGKMRVVAKGARKLLSRKAGHLEPFTRVTLMLGRGRDLSIVTQAQTVDPYLGLRDELAKTGFAAYVVELLERFTYEEGENKALYDLLCNTLERLAGESDLPPLLRYYELRLLDLVGFRPQLFQCVGCGKEITAVDQFFSASSGGVLCPVCGPGAPFVKPVSVTALKYLRHFQRSSYADAHRAGLPGGIRTEMEALMNYYLTFVLEQGLKTPGFIRSVEKRNDIASGGN